MRAPFFDPIALLQPIGTCERENKILRSQRLMLGHESNLPWQGCLFSNNAIARPGGCPPLPGVKVMRSTFFLALSLVALMLGFTTFPGCGHTREDDLEQRVSALEKNIETLQKRYADRQAKLEECIDVDAEGVYWAVLQSKGKIDSPGVYRAPRSVWREAREQKRRKVQECKLLWAH